MRRREAWLRRPPALIKLVGALSVVSLWLIAGMSATVWIWALYFPVVRRAGRPGNGGLFLPGLVHHAGLGDIVLAQPYRLLSGMLAANGLVLFGLTTAVLIDLIRSLHDARTGQDSA